VRDDERYEQEFIPIGKAYGGYTDEELHQLNDKISELKVARYGPTLALKPSLMVEIEFDDVQVNNRTKAGYTLRLPRFRSIRWDLGPDDTDTLRDVDQLYRQKLNRDRKKQGDDPSFVYPGKDEERN
jgi:DNA ligase-1